MKSIRLGVFGAGRGLYLAECCKALGAEIVALCEGHKERREAAMAKLDPSVTAYESFDEFIEHPMDAVILANNFYQHAPYAIKCFERNLHVYSECTANATMKEGVALVRAHEKSQSIYMLAENYPQMLFNREMKRVVDGGTLGKIMFAEGEYNHPFDPWDTNFTKNFLFYPKHWRHFMPATYYITHALGPVMYATGAIPKKVSAFPMYAPLPDDVPNASFNADRAANITTLNNDGSVFRVTGWAQYGAPDHAYRICGTKGQIENLRGMDGRVMLRYNEWDVPEGAEREASYMPSWNDKDEAFISKFGHGGADYLAARLFLDCVKEGVQPPHPFDLYSTPLFKNVNIDE